MIPQTSQAFEIPYPASLQGIDGINASMEKDILGNIVLSILFWIDHCTFKKINSIRLT